MLDSRFNRPRRPLARRFFVAALAVGLFAVGYQWGHQRSLGRETPPSITGVLLRPSLALPDWQLQDSSAQPLGAAHLNGSWVLLGFASFASQAGQATVTRLVELFNRLADQPELRARLRLVLVTPDLPSAPERSIERLTAQALVLTGTEAQRAHLRSMLNRSDESDDVMISTSSDGTQPTPALLYLLDPTGKLIALFPAEQAPVTVAEDLRQLANWREHAR